MKQTTVLIEKQTAWDVKLLFIQFFQLSGI